MQNYISTDYSEAFSALQVPGEPFPSLDEKSKRLLLIVIPVCGGVVLFLLIVLIIIIVRYYCIITKTLY